MADLDETPLDPSLAPPPIGGFDDAPSFAWPPPHWFDATGNLIMPGQGVPGAPELDVAAGRKGGQSSGGRGLDMTAAPPAQNEIANPMPAGAPAPPPPDVTSGALALPPPPETTAALPTPPPIDAISGVDSSALAAPDLRTPVEREFAGMGAEVRTEGTPEEEADLQERGLEALTPEERLRIDAAREATRQQTLAKGELEAATKDREDAQKNYARFVSAENENKQARAQVETDIQQLGSQKLDTSLPIWRTVAGVIASAIGGLAAPYMGGRNVGLEAFERGIDRHVQAQQAEMANKRQALGMRMQSLNEKQSQDNADYRTTEVQRAVAYEQAIRQAQAEAQNYDPRGTTASRIAGLVTDLRTRQQAAVGAWQQQDLKNRLDVAKAQSEIEERAANAEKARAETAKTLSKVGAGGGEGSATNPHYTVATGFFDPFDPTAPVMGKRAIGGKGEDAKERNTVAAQLGTYAHVQDYWAKLAQIGAKIDYDKGLGETAWGKLRGTDADEYEKARHALVVYLTKELGDKLTQGQIDEQSQRIPDRATIIESRDPGREIADAQQDADRDFTRDMNLVGINADPIVKNAQSRRQPAVAPNPEDAVAAAQAAMATASTPTERKDAAAAHEAALERLKHRNEQAAAGKDAVRQATIAKPHPALSTDDLPAGFAAEVQDRNEAAHTYEQYIKKLHALPEPSTKGKLKGDADKATQDHQALVEQHALKVTQSRRALDDADRRLADGLVQTLGAHDFGGLPREKVDAIAKAVGVDPSKFGADMNGQVEVGKFIAKLHGLDDYKRGKLVQKFFGQ